MTFTEKIEKTRSLISHDHLDQALAQLGNLAPRERQNELLICKRNLSENRVQFRLGLKNLDDFNVSNARITMALLELLDELTGEEKSNKQLEWCMRQGRQKLEEKDFASAKIYFDKVLIENNHIMEAYLDRGAAKLALKEFEEALVDFSTVINKEPQNPIALYNRGVAFFQLGELDQAYQDWKLVQELGYDMADEVLNFFLHSTNTH